MGADALPMQELRSLINRPGRYVGREFTWAVLYANGLYATEDAYASLSLVPRMPDNPIVALAVVAVREPENESLHKRVLLPEGTEPVIFWRSTRNSGTGASTAVTIIGYEYPNGVGQYLYCYDDGHAVLTSNRYFYGR